MRAPAMSDTLTAMLELPSLPLRAVETPFAGDSSGFGTSNMHTWFSTKHGREITRDAADPVQVEHRRAARTLSVSTDVPPVRLTTATTS